MLAVSIFGKDKEVMPGILTRLRAITAADLYLRLRFLGFFFILLGNMVPMKLPF